MVGINTQIPISPTPVSMAPSSTLAQQTQLTVVPPFSSNMLLPTVLPPVPNIPSPDANKIILSSIFAAVLLMIAISLTIFLISLSLTYWKKRKSYRERTRDLYTQSKLRVTVVFCMCVIITIC